MALRPIEWVLATDSEGFKVIGLSQGSYEDLSKNTADIFTFLKYRELVILYYLDCIKRHNEGTDEN